MKLLNFDAYMFQPDKDYWKRALQTLPRENLEKNYFDNTLQSGVLTGLEVQQQAAPNLTVLIRAGRGVYRDPVTKRAVVMELHQDLTLDMSAFLPLGTPTTVKVVASPALNTTSEAPISVLNAPATLIDPDGTNPAHPDYDPAFTPYSFNPLERDDIFIEVDSTPTGNQIVLAEVTLSVGQTQILSSQINNTVRSPASNAGALSLVITKVAALEALTTSHTTSIADHAARINVLETNVAGLLTTVGGLANHEARITGLEIVVNQPTLVETFIPSMPDSGGGVATLVTVPVTIAQNFANRTVMVHVSAVNITFLTGTVELLVNLPGAPFGFIAEANPTGASPNDQQSVLSGVFPWGVGNINTNGGALTVQLRGLSGAIFETLNAQRIRVTLHTID